MVPNCSHEFLSFWDIGRSRNFGGGGSETRLHSCWTRPFQCGAQRLGFDLHGTQLGWGIGFACGHQGVADSFRSRVFRWIHTQPLTKASGAEDSFWRKAEFGFRSFMVVLFHTTTTPLQIFLWWRKNSGRETFFAALFLDHLGPGGSHCGCICGMGPWIPMTSGNMVPCWFLV